MSLVVVGCRWVPKHNPFESWKVVALLGLVTGVAFKSAFKIDLIIFQKAL